MRKLVLAAVNARFSHTNISIRYMRNSVSGLDYRVVLHEFTINHSSAQIAGALARENPDIAAFSVYIWNATIIGEVIALLGEALPECVIVLGGPEVTYSHDRWLDDHPRVDYIVRGPGEAGFRALAENRMTADTPVIEVPNPHFNQIPFPYIASDFAGLDNRTIYYESSRGCPFRCDYCLSSRSDHGLEFRDSGRVMDELGFIMEHSPAYVKFVDRTFNADRGRCRDLWAHIIDRYGGSPTLFHFEVNPALLGDEDFRLLESCPKGLFQFELGVQSTSEAALRAVNRSGDFAVIKSSIERLVAMKNIHAHVDLIAGLPLEDENSLRRSFNEIYALGADHFQPGLLKILHGTAMKERADAEGYVYSALPPYQVISTPWLSAESVEVFESVAYLVERLYNGGYFPLTLQRLAGMFPSPYDCYCDMQAFYGRRSGALLDRGRESCASFLADYAQSKIAVGAHAQSKNYPEPGAQRKKSPEMTVSDGVAQSNLAEIGIAQSKTTSSGLYLLDCIRWDWCGSSTNRHYPGTLKTESTRRAAKRFMGTVHQFMKEGGPASPPLRAEEVKKAIVFCPESEKFRNEFMGGHDIAVFVPGRPGPLFA